MTTTPSLSSVRVLDRSDRHAALDVVAENPVAHVFIGSRLLNEDARSWDTAGELWGWVADGRLRSLGFAGANLVPAETTPEARAAFAERGRRQGRRCSSLVGPAEEVLDLWDQLAPAWGRAREVRRDQPLMAITTEPLVEADDGVRPVRPDEVDLLLPAAVAMFTEEVGVSPLAGDGGSLYRARVQELVDDGRAFARFDGDRVVFKAELGAITPWAVQVQGVWVAPELRGQGLSSPGMASVVHWARDRFAPVVSLYVNDYNEAARRSYIRTGFADVGTFATVLF